MKIQVNGQAAETQAHTVRELLEERKLAERPVAVEVNGALIAARQHASHILSEGDIVELVTLVGGG